MEQPTSTGVDNLVYALITQDNVSGYVADTPVALAPVATVSAEGGDSLSPDFFDNKPKSLLRGQGGKKLTFDIQGLSPEAKATLLGKVYDSTTGLYMDGEGIAPYVAVGFRGLNEDGTHHYWWFLKCVFMEPKVDLETKTEQAKSKHTILEAQSIFTNYEFVQSGTVTSASRLVEADEGDTNLTSESTWFDAVVQPIGGSHSAVTCTPSPADGATGVSAAVHPTLTFNNALMTSTKGILLTKNDGAIVTATISIDADNKVITITPGSNLTSSAKYLIAVAGAKDIFGQVLASAVYDFTIA